MFHHSIKPGTLHDSFCRCRACKPPLVGQATIIRRARNFRVLALVVLGVWGGVIAALYPLAVR